MINVDNIDYKKYLKMNPDLKDALNIKDETCDNELKDVLWNHWNLNGRNEKRTCFSLTHETNLDTSLFDYNFYTKKYQDLREFTYEEALNHYIRSGYYEGRLINDERTVQSDKYIYGEWMINANNIDYKKYLKMNPDLKDALKIKDETCDNVLKDVLWNHWNLNGRKEKRKCFSLNNENNIDISFFDYYFYTKKYQDLREFTHEEALNHYIKSGYYEGRLINDGRTYQSDEYIYEELIPKYINEFDTSTLTNVANIDISLFDYNFYTRNYLDLREFSQAEAINHYIQSGYCEGRLKNDGHIFQNEKYNYIYDELIPKYTDGLEVFLYENKITKKYYNENINWQFRYFCYYYTPYIRNIILPITEYGNKYEAVLVEFRILPNLEFLLRNTIDKLGPNWSHTIVCGNLNYDFLKSLIEKINRKIKIIKLDYDNIDAGIYSKILTEISFWEHFTCDRLLLYQEDSILLHTNIMDFVEYSYVGAPWPNISPQYYVNDLDVGNGGFSIRDPKVMINVIKTIKIEETDFSTIRNWLNHYLLSYSCPPEDVYFANNIIKYKLGKMPSKNIAKKFSSESIFDSESVGGHQIWLNNKEWKEFLEKTLIHKFKPTFSFYYTSISHYGGMKDIQKNMCKNFLYDNEQSVFFLDTVELFFLINSCTLKQKWSGMIHWCSIKDDSTEWLEESNISRMFQKKNFIESMRSCTYLITTSNYLKKYVLQELHKINMVVPVYTIKHPVEYSGNHYFNYQKFILNQDKKILQIGQQYRKISSIYKLNNVNYSKYWLTGVNDMNLANTILNRWLDFVDESVDKNTVKMLYTETKEEYDILLSNNIIFLDLYASSANNVILEAIIRNTPIIVNKMDAIIEYLGKSYPLYYENLDEVDELLNNYDKILKAHLHLQNMNKTDISFQSFIKQIININHTVNTRRGK